MPPILPKREYLLDGRNSLIVLIVVLVLGSNASTEGYTPFLYGQHTAPGMDKWFKDAKLGMFMHWGPVSQASSMCPASAGFPCCGSVFAKRVDAIVAFV